MEENKIIVKNYKNNKEIDYVILYIDFLKKLNIYCQSIIKVNRKDKEIEFSYIKGILINDIIIKYNNLKEEYLNKLIRLISKIHSKQIVNEFDYKIEKQRFFSQIIEYIENNKDDSPFNNQLTEKLKNFLINKFPKNLNFDIIHGDINLGNIVFFGSNIGVIDFGSVKFYPKEIDLLDLYFGDYKKNLLKKYCGHEVLDSIIQNLKKNEGFFQVYYLLIQGRFVDVKKILSKI